jgi:hypothetical protein
MNTIISYEFNQTMIQRWNTEELLERMIELEESECRGSIEDHILIAIKYGSVDEYIEIFSDRLKNINFVYECVSLDKHRFHIMDDDFLNFVDDFEPKRLSHIFDLLRNYTVQNMTVN